MTEKLWCATPDHWYDLKAFISCDTNNAEDAMKYSSCMCIRDCVGNLLSGGGAEWLLIGEHALGLLVAAVLGRKAFPHDHTTRPPQQVR
jgi:hypothetical protein